MSSVEQDGAGVTHGISEFQRTIVRLEKPDGRVDPGGRALRAMLSKSGTAPVPPTLIKPAVMAPRSGSLRFPLASRPAESYKHGMRRFGSNRKGGRLHAGCDLYAKVGTPVLSMDDGEVKLFYEFYLGTWALEVRHPNFVARYGEITGKLPQGVKVGAKITRGQTIGYVGHLNGLNMSMLHLELYSGMQQVP